MESKLGRIGVLTSGGDAPGMNAAIRAVVRTASSKGIECVGIRRGYQGLLNNDCVVMDPKSVSKLTSCGGTILYTARSKEFTTPEGCLKAAQNCKYAGIDGLVAIGGDGTFKGLLSLSKQNISVVGIPATIDNDIGCTSYTIGFDTACNTAIEAIDKLNDTMRSHERCSIVEVMGHESGNLAMHVGIASGATAILIPEKQLDFEIDIAEKIRYARLRGRTNFLVIIAEGAGNAKQIADRITAETGIESRVTVLGHLQRGGSPLVRDRIIASRMGYEAVNALAAGKTNRVICMRGDDCVDMDINEALKIQSVLDKTMFTMLESLTFGV